MNDCASSFDYKIKILDAFIKDSGDEDIIRKLVFNFIR